MHPRTAGLVLAALSTAISTSIATGIVLVTPAQAAAPTVELQPDRLARGADVAVPHIEDGDFVDGDRRVELPGTVARMIGRSGDDWLVSLLDVDATRVILGGNGRVFQWKPASDRSRTLVRKRGGLASIEHDLLSIYTKDPYLGGCTKLVKLSKPRVKVWRSCRDRVTAVSPDGTQMLTFHILTDGLGPDEIRLREVDGARLTTFRTGWFSGWAWESPGTLLLDTNGTRKAATVRCTLDACENATDPVKVRMP
jgi:hypothetical protein